MLSAAWAWWLRIDAFRSDFLGLSSSLFNAPRLTALRASNSVSTDRHGFSVWSRYLGVPWLRGPRVTIAGGFFKTSSPICRVAVISQVAL
jgi:hypothetical protein